MSMSFRGKDTIKHFLITFPFSKAISIQLLYQSPSIPPSRPVLVPGSDLDV